MTTKLPINAAARTDAAEFATLQTYLSQHHADVKPPSPGGLAAWAWFALEKSAPAAEPYQALSNLGTAIELALAQEAASDVLSVLTGAFVGLTTELVRRQGHDESKKIKVNSGGGRGITIHAVADDSPVSTPA